MVRPWRIAASDRAAPEHWLQLRANAVVPLQPRCLQAYLQDLQVDRRFFVAHESGRTPR
jgi:hypothetical protein